MKKIMIFLSAVVLSAQAQEITPDSAQVQEVILAPKMVKTKNTTPAGEETIENIKESIGCFTLGYGSAFVPLFGQFFVLMTMAMPLIGPDGNVKKGPTETVILGHIAGLITLGTLYNRFK